jgi:amino acid adenylation domain-containing protein
MTGGRIHRLLDRRATESPDRLAIRTLTDDVTYGRFGDQTRRLASSLTSAGLRRGDRILILLPNGPAIPTLIMAASRIGTIFCIVNPGVKAGHLRHILIDAEPRLIVTTAAWADILVNQVSCKVAAVERDWARMLDAEPIDGEGPGISEDLACLIYTSGSTALPKAVMSTHRNISFATAAIHARLQLLSSDVIATVVPLSFDYGLYQIFLTLESGATLAIGSETEAGPGLLTALREWRATVLPIVPSLGLSLIRLAERDRADLPHLRVITNTGAHLHAATIARLQELFPATRIYVMFGLTECKRTSILDPREYPDKPGSVGRPLPDTECLIVGEHGQLLPPGEIGELVVRGAHVMAGYWRAPDLTAKRFRQWGPGREQALFTGDRCHLDAEGYLYFHGRQDDIYKQGGFRVSALELEAAACSVDGVEQAAVLIPKDDEPALLVVTGSVTQEQVLAALRRRLEEYKLPARVLIMERVPLSINGKIDKRALQPIAASVLAS